MFSKNISNEMNISQNIDNKDTLPVTQIKPTRNIFNNDTSNRNIYDNNTGNRNIYDNNTGNRNFDSIITTNRNLYDASYGISDDYGKYL